MGYKFLEPIKLGNVEVKNRVIFLAMAKFFSNADNTVSDRDLAYIRSVAEGGAGLIVPGGMIIDPTWPSVMPMVPGIYSDAFIPGLKKYAEAGHQNGAKIVFQLWHPGQVKYSKKTPKTINELSIDEIKDIQQKYYAAAVRAVEAGADGVEFQLCHNYLGEQFLSPLFNQRHDEYGIDSLESRTRFAVETMALLRKAIGPDKILSVKLQGFDAPDKGFSMGDAAAAAPVIEKAGADVITVSAGGTITGTDFMSGDQLKAPGWKVPWAKAVREVVSVPVCATDSIRTPELANEIIENGSCDLVGIGRGIYAEREWVKKAEEGREKEMRSCLNCMNCYNMNFFTGRSGCSVNPFAGREYEQTELKKDGNGRVAVIAGAGPAGLEAAITLAQRDFKVILFESKDEIGGCVNYAKVPPHKERLQQMIDFYKNELDRLGVDVRLGCTATADLINALDPYSVIVATGTSPAAAPIPGSDGKNVVQVRDLLAQHMDIQGKKVVIIGAGHTGIEGALYLQDKGNSVCLVDMKPAPDLENGLMDGTVTVELSMEYARALMLGIEFRFEQSITEITETGIKAAPINTGEPYELNADLVVLSLGVKRNTDIYDQLFGKRPQVYKIGDANFGLKITTAVMAGSKVGYLLK